MFNVEHATGQVSVTYTCLSVPPMGFTWSLAMEQMANEWQVEQALQSERCLRLSVGSGGRTIPSDGGGVYYVYVEKHRDRRPARRGRRPLRPQGIGPLDRAQLRVPPSVCRRIPHGDLGGSSSGATRGDSGPLRKGSGAFGQPCLGPSGGLCGRQLEILLGPCVYFVLLRRAALRTLDGCCRFVRAHYNQHAPLWGTLLKALRAFRRLMPLIATRWSRPWRSMVVCCDFCDEGRGAGRREWPRGVVRELGSMPQRARDRRVYGGAGPRASLLGCLDPFSDPFTVVSPELSLSDHHREWVKLVPS